ncbi:DUF6712 family protein [Arcicella aquatica]|uniref:DUF6712 family protein n=1 Tax=Arcicella aquatica TaxID=217141 RepID=A0ABU5QQV8_9BACT|nr:DUF6712 family protein [Arcicella aquatica]MEA5259470.1 DUF6712 family protein [Arcicella aquatica]
MLVNETIFKAQLGGIQSSINWKTVEPFVKMAARTFRKQIGREFYTELANNQSDEDMAELADLAKGIEAWQGYDLAFPHLKLKVGDLGLMKSSPANSVAITKWEYVDSREANMTMVDKLQEDFYQLLEEVEPESWKGTEAYKIRRRLFIRSASELGRKITLVGRNSRFFDVLTTYIERAENSYIRPLLTNAVFDVLKEKWQNGTELSSLEKQLINHIQWALAYLSLYEAYPYLPLVVDMNGIREARFKDGTREEETASDKLKNSQKQALWNDGTKFLKNIETFMNDNATATQWAAYYQKNLLNNDFEADDFTDKPHVIL